ncbi:MAG: 50S ribosomal protein L23 [Lentisphaeria bacterium]|nr:50S ribosomal protein L23 [Lentisphaeria bacterium]
MKLYDIIKTVRVTEKSQTLSIEHQQYSFEIHPKATKDDVKRAIKEIFDRDVQSVNVLKRQGKTRRTRVGIGKKADKKIAIVSLKEGQEPLDLF